MNTSQPSTLAGVEFNELQVTAHNTSSDNGFWDHFDKCTTVEGYNRDVATRLMLIADEAHEALAEIRSHKFTVEDDKSIFQFTQAHEYAGDLPESFGEELADIVIRTMDLAEGLGINLHGHIVEKVEKNKDRTFRHGKNF